MSVLSNRLENLNPRVWGELITGQSAENKLDIAARNTAAAAITAQAPSGLAQWAGGNVALLAAGALLVALVYWRRG